MKLIAFAIPYLWATAFELTSAGSPAAVPVLQARNAPGRSTRQTLQHIARSLNAVKIQGRDSTFKSNKTVLDTTWSGATLLKQGLSVHPRPLSLFPSLPLTSPND